MAAYLALSKMHEDPSAQGATQVVSALRYFFALDRFFEVNHRNCNTRNRDDKVQFNRFVGDFCHISESKGVKYYTTNFYLPLKEHNGDYNIGSNFYSAGQVKVSLSNNGAILDYPQRGSFPLFKIQNGELIVEKSYYNNLFHYLPSNEVRVALAVWLCRYQYLNIDKVDLSGQNLYNGLKLSLNKLYSENLINLLLGDEAQSVAILDSYPIVYTPKQCVVFEPRNIEALFPDFFQTSSNIETLEKIIFKDSDTEHYTEGELASILKRMYNDGVADKTQVARIHLFGLKYFSCINKGNYSTKVIAQKASISDNYSVEIDKGIRLAKLIANNANGVAFYNPNASYLRQIDPQQNPTDANYSRYLAAMRTKPFLLLAGISGTGKSRIVKEMAFASCPPSLRDADQISPGNYCMIEVKPNWHDSTELIGYVSRIGGEHYVVTPFVNFLIKAWHNPKAPFFVCLDEMNLAPVEQYFAEFLSVLESRKLNNGEIVSEPLVKAEYTKEHIEDFKTAYSGKKHNEGYGMATSTSDPAATYGSDIFADIAENGLRLPPNVIVIGTVNMDETTYQFSRKVIDRAMTIEMNEVDFDAMFTKNTDTLKYTDPYMGAEFFLPKYTAAKDALEVMSEEDRALQQSQLPALLKQLDATLRTTPFRVAYRAQNELILYFAALREEQPDADASQLLTTAIDDILMMKVLPRIEGNEDTLEQPLKELADFTAEKYLHAAEKIEEMQERLKANHFTSFWP